MISLQERVKLLEQMVASLLLHQHWIPNTTAEASPPAYLRSDGELSVSASDSIIFPKGLLHYHSTWFVDDHGKWSPSE